MLHCLRQGHSLISAGHFHMGDTSHHHDSRCFFNLFITVIYGYLYMYMCVHAPGGQKSLSHFLELELQAP